MRGELLAQRRDDLERETLLFVPCPPHQMAQCRRRQLLSRGSKQRVRFDCANNVAAMYFTEMLFHFLATAEAFPLRHVQTNEFRLPALLFDPLFDDRLVLHDFHLRFVNLEGHPGKALGVQLAQFVLIIVIIWRAENDAAESALRDERVSALRRIGWRALGFVERVEVLS